MWIIVISACSAITLIIVLVMCSCWKRKRQKDDWLGLDGMVTQKSPDENVNHLPSATIPAASESVAVAAVVDDVDSKRPIVANNTRRSLPDIPSEIHARGDGVWEPNGDNSSELYATVEPYHNLAKRHTLPNGIDTRPSISQHSSISQADDAFSPYASVNYDKLNKLEHPYAIVKPPTTSEQNEILEEPTVRTCLLPADCASTSAAPPDPLPPPRSRRGSTQSNVGLDINAASAVAGGIAASQELPYMTPPVGPVAQTNFSGDSQDSSKGYTSISVREPLANIIAQTKEMNKTKRALDPHYSTVSDDSDEMYTTIPDPNNQEYTSGSETYAQIQPVPLTVAVEVNPVPSSSSTAATSSATVETNEAMDTYDAAPQPPSVDSLKNMTNTHSRQASSSSSVLNLGSPKPEKRQANSPLPPPPSATSPDFLQHKNLDDMYAKVHKNRKKSDDSEREPLNNRKSVSSCSSNEEKKVEPDPPKVLRREHNYETLKKSPRKDSDPGYEKLKLKDCEPGYASINGPDSLTTDPGYEVLNKNPSDTNYELIKDQIAGYSTINETNKPLSIAGYSVINKQHKLNLKHFKQKEIDEPNYESMPNDPNYESVSQSDANYESVKYFDMGYERITTDTDESSRTDSNKNSGYETVESEPPYEKLNDEQNSNSESSAITTDNDYENVRREDEDEIFQV